MKEIVLHPHDHKTVRDWRHILAFLDRTIVVSPQSVAELGGGYGNIAYHYASRGAAAVVLDTDPSCLLRAHARDKKIRTICRDINLPLPWNDESFDLVSCTGTLHYGYVKDTSTIIREMVRVSRRYVLIDILSRYSPYRLMEQLYNPTYNPRAYSSRATRALLAPYNLLLRGRMGGKSLPLIKNLFPFTGKTVYCLFEKNIQ